MKFLFMSFITILLIAVGLAMDCLAVSIGIGLMQDNFKFKQGLKLAAVFGLFHIIMPTVGWLIGTPFKSLIGQVDHWIALAILSFIGIKMMYEAWHNKEEKTFDISRKRILFGLALATSIDALIVGVSLALLEVNILMTAITFGGVTFIIALLGAGVGKHSGEYIGKWAEFLGGIALIAIGLKIFIEHVFLK